MLKNIWPLNKEVPGSIPCRENLDANCSKLSTLENKIHCIGIRSIGNSVV